MQLAVFPQRCIQASADSARFFLVLILSPENILSWKQVSARPPVVVTVVGAVVVVAGVVVAGVVVAVAGVVVPPEQEHIVAGQFGGTWLQFVSHQAFMLALPACAPIARQVPPPGAEDEVGC